MKAWPIVLILIAGYLGVRLSNDQDMLARTIWGEARGEGVPGMEAVAAVVMNRVASRRYPDNVLGVIFQDKQFSAWNIGDPNRARSLAVTDSDLQFVQAKEIAGRAVSGMLVDRTGGATHYHTKAVNPFWADANKISATVGNHIFYRGIA